MYIIKLLLLKLERVKVVQEQDSTKNSYNRNEFAYKKVNLHLKFY